MSTSIGTRIFTRLFGKKVGQDDYGNEYYRCSCGSKMKERRWVIYPDEADGSAVPPNWQGWLTHTLKLPPTQDPPVIRDWMIGHQPNLSGTPKAYHPSGATPTGENDVSRGNYEPWEPN